MAKLHPMSSTQERDLGLLEHTARDIVTQAKAIEALLPLHQGMVTIGLTPEAYASALHALVASAQSKD